MSYSKDIGEHQCTRWCCSPAQDAERYISELKQASTSSSDQRPAGPLAHTPVASRRASESKSSSRRAGPGHHLDSEHTLVYSGFCCASSCSHCGGRHECEDNKDAIVVAHGCLHPEITPEGQSVTPPGPTIGGSTRSNSHVKVCY